FVDSLSRALPIMSVLLTLVITVGTVITGIDNSENSDSGTDDPPITSPEENKQARTNLFNAINTQRLNSVLSGEAIPGVTIDIMLHANAQQQAEQNALAGGYTEPVQDSADKKILMLQSRLDSQTATTDAILHRWADDTANYDALMDPANTAIGVGLAEMNGKTYAVVQFTQQ
ncbi:CAP domain-containing protein, partial [uncultured Corynebacterium sp.]|uniref:CAP domain-containing protein n=1 Tax=uncultured Corynebacterium sp. TaxID=159447 RepID=UPI0025D88D3B